MTKYISFSLFGENTLYEVGAVENLALMPLVYPGWRSIFYVSESINPKVVDQLTTFHSEVEVIKEHFSTEREQLIKGMYWRLYALEKHDATHVIFRDCDSRISSKESAAVTAWVDSKCDFHFMYDHPFHSVPILGGMWGARAETLRDIRARIDRFWAKLAPDASYWEQCDQSFLRSEVWSEIAGSSRYLAHGEVEICEYHIKEGISIQPFPKYPALAESGFAKPDFVGQTIHVPGSKPKTPKV